MFLEQICQPALGDTKKDEIKGSRGGEEVLNGGIQELLYNHTMSKESVSLLNYHTTFPKIVYPTETHSESHTGRRYRLSSSAAATTTTTTTTTRTFNLGVYNLVPIPSHAEHLAPVDPLCLSTLLSILSKEKLTFPKLGDEVDGAGAEHSSSINCVSVLSFHASVDDQLPILVEDSKDRASHRVLRKIHGTKMINVLNSSKLSTQDTLVYNLINTQLFDFYNLSVLGLDDETLLRYYSLLHYNFSDTLQSFTPLSKYLAADVRLSLLKRNDFHLRNPDIFSYFSSYLTAKSTKLSYLSECDRIKRNALALFSLFNQTLSRTTYWSSDGKTSPSEPGVVDFQLASLLYSMKLLADRSPVFDDVLSQNNILVSHSNKIVDSFL